MKSQKNGEYKYTSGDVVFKGEFNIYQAKNGKIILVMNTKFTELTKQQINDLAIDCYSLLDFDIDLFNKNYEQENKLKDIEIEEHFPYARSLTDFGAQIGAKWARNWYENKFKNK